MLFSDTKNFPGCRCLFYGWGSFFVCVFLVHFFSKKRTKEGAATVFSLLRLARVTGRKNSLRLNSFRLGRFPHLHSALRCKT